MAEAFHVSEISLKNIKLKLVKTGILNLELSPLWKYEIGLFFRLSYVKISLTNNDE